MKSAFAHSPFLCVVFTIDSCLFDKFNGFFQIIKFIAIIKKREKDEKERIWLPNFLWAMMIAAIVIQSNLFFTHFRHITK